MKKPHKWTLEDWLIYLCAIGVMVVLLLFLVAMAGCTVVPQDQTGENAQPHSTVLPATVICLFAACDNQFSDRAQRAGADAGSTTGDIEADQTATAVPTVTIPLTGSAPVGSLSGVSKLLEKTDESTGTTGTTTGTDTGQDGAPPGESVVSEAGENAPPEAGGVAG